MSAQISADHPIRGMFGSIVERAFRSEGALVQPPLPEYVANLLVDFTHRDRIFSVRDASGRVLDEVGEMLLEGDISLNANSFEREREVHKQIGDFTLFWAGVYPEMLRTLRRADRRDHLIDYVDQGRKSYRIASTFDYGRYAGEAPILRRLSENFEVCVQGLRGVRRELDAHNAPETIALRRLLS